MCGRCGCGSDTKPTLINLETGQEVARGHGPADDHPGHEHNDPRIHERAHPAGARGSHAHGHDHRNSDEQDCGGMHPRGNVVGLEARILAKNDALGEKNRAFFSGREILALNLVSSPGAGKTTLLERTIRDLKQDLQIFVIEGDQATTADGERIRAAGAAAVQVNTGTGCHLEADMVARGLAELEPEPGCVLMIENVGNLVCPALFDLGERAKVVILSVTEGEDKPLKYPYIFRAARIMILSKGDLLPHVDFDESRCIANARQVNPDILALRLSARTGEGLDQWYQWIRGELAAAREAAFTHQ
jgi:hydrogenase nickel incorporation protein HypB